MIDRAALAVDEHHRCLRIRLQLHQQIPDMLAIGVGWIRQGRRGRPHCLQITLSHHYPHRVLVDGHASQGDRREDKE